jgi:cysteinyl-tRNA synthetase
MVTIRLTNSKTRKKEDFAPIDPLNVRMYVCGPTVYDRAHLGNARPVVVFDVLNRLLRHVYGPEHVTYVRNFTDVDDKINAEALRRQKAGAPGTLEDLIHERTEETIAWYHADMDALGALRPNIEPRATEWIGAMVAMTADLIAKGNAYAANGHVLFRVRSYKDYGKLSGRSIDDMIAGARVEVAPFKEDPMDFVLWKPSSGEEPGWESPWGKGRPGWHIECSAMAHELLGESFDIHGGGLDLQFPHHENEIAQSACAHPHGDFAHYWLHNEMVLVDGKKMSKSLGNFFTVREKIEQFDRQFSIENIGPAIRLRFLQSHYRSEMEIGDSYIEAAAIKLGTWSRLIEENISGDPPDNVSLLPELIQFLCDDLSTPEVVRLLEGAASTLKKLPDSYFINNFADSQESLAWSFLASLEFLGFDRASIQMLNHEHWNARLKARQVASKPVVESLIESLLKERAHARALKDFRRADEIRDAFAAAGVIVKDTKAGIVWELAPNFDPAKLEALQ